MNLKSLKFYLNKTSIKIFHVNLIFIVRFLLSMIRIIIGMFFLYKLSISNFNFTNAYTNKYQYIILT